MTAVFARGQSALNFSKKASFFPKDFVSGRQIICGFSYLQRIGKGATTNLWFSKDTSKEWLEKNKLDSFKIEWAAVRQFELLQEAGNLSIEDLEFMDFKRAFHNLMKMRAGGYRITMIALGKYNGEREKDDLQILDTRIQEEITQIIQMLYLEEQSSMLSRDMAKNIEKGSWNYVDALPHVAIAVGASALFAKKRKQENLSRDFFRILNLLPQKHIKHDIAVGLALPDFTNERHWIYLAKGEHQFSVYTRMFSDVFRAFDFVSLGELHERANAGSEIIAAMRHMRGYGDRLACLHEEKNRAAARAVCPRL